MIDVFCIGEPPGRPSFSGCPGDGPVGLASGARLRLSSVQERPGPVGEQPQPERGSAIAV